MMLTKNIIICGFIGSGKSTLGPVLARRLSAEFIDSDDFIESREGLTIPELFRRYSEQGFRDREHKALLELSHRSGIVLSTGAGALTYSRNVLPLKRTGVLLFINADFEECYRRIKDSDRPLVRSNTREQLEKMYEVRNSHYRTISDYEIPAVGTARELSTAAIKLMRLK